MYKTRLAGAQSFAMVNWWHGVLQDIHLAVRGFRRRPSFALVVVLTLAIGIAATTTMFTVLNAVLLRPPPYDRPERLVHVWETVERNVARRDRTSYPNLLDWRAEAGVFAGLEGYDVTNVAVRHRDHSEMMQGAHVTAGFFDLLGVAPLLGGALTTDRDVPEVMLSYELWARLFGADPHAIGKTVTVNGTARTVVGVLPPEFRFVGGDDDIWLPAGRSDAARADRSDRWLTVIGRLRDGVTLDVAERHMTSLMRRLAIEHPVSNAERSVTLTQLRDDIVGSVRRPVIVLFVAVAIVLLIACVNVASLVLARALDRTHELALRSAIGASRARLLRQLLTENLVLALGGAALGGWLAFLGVPLLVDVLPQSLFNQAPSLRDVAVDVPALIFTSAVALVLGVALGLLPGALLPASPVSGLLGHDVRVSASRASRRLRDGMVVAQIAMTLVLLVGATLMGRSLVALLRIDPGFTPSDVVLARVNLAGPAYADRWQQTRFFEEAVAAVRSIPGVSVAGAISRPPLHGSGTHLLRVDGAAEPSPSARQRAAPRVVAGDYFTALRIPVKEGRVIGAQDNLRSPYAVVINELLARQLFGDRPAVGQRIRFFNLEDRAWTIVGVVGDVHTNNLDEPVAPTVYYSHLQEPENRMTLVARTTGADPSRVISAMTRVVHKLDPTLAVSAARTMADHIADNPAAFRRRYMLFVLGAFAVAALLLAVIGVYGVVGYDVTQRTREIAIRLALGATGAAIVRLVMRRGLRLLAAGVAFGSVVALGLSRVLESLLFGVSPADVATYAMAGTLMAVVAIVASYLPARRASRFDPGIPLRSE